MTCEESVERMSELLDGLPSEALETHLGGCPSCREDLESMRRADEALRRHPSLEWKPEMTEAILRRAKRPRFGPLLVVAASLLVAAVVVFLLYRRGPDADLYAAGLRHLAQGQTATLDRLIENHPESAYADASCLALADHYSKSGDDLSALACYASIRQGGSITPEVVRSIREAGRNSGRAFAGPRPLVEADLETLRRCAETRTPYGLARTTPEGRTEFYLLGPVGPDPLSCAAPGHRKRRIEPDAPVADPVVREMLGAMKGLAK